MTRSIGSLLRVAVVVLVFAVVLCLVLPMSGGGDAGMNFALACCFVLAIALSVFLLRQPREMLVLGDAFGSALPLVRGPTRTARAPDIVELGSLLI
ncbi:MAG TPA: hypothetical protein VGB64_13480 [Actinomycetota bacterium]